MFDPKDPLTSYWDKDGCGPRGANAKAETERCGDYSGGWRIAAKVLPGPKCACTYYVGKTYCSKKDGLCYRNEGEASKASEASAAGRTLKAESGCSVPSTYRISWASASGVHL